MQLRKTGEAMSRRHRRKALNRKELLASCRSKIEERLLARARQHMGADFTPQMEALLRAELRK